MLRTKLAKKILTKKEQKHLTNMGITSIKKLKEARKHQRDMKVKHFEKFPYLEPCMECWHIAQKLGLEEAQHANKIL